MKSIHKIALFASVVVATTGASYAFAASGTYSRGPGEVVFFYGQSSGNADGNRVSGRTQYRQCLDAPGRTGEFVTVVSELKEDRRFAPDPVLQRISARYSEPERRSAFVGTKSNGRYYPLVTWNYYAGNGAGANGYGRILC